MKKFLAIAAIAATTMVACNENNDAEARADMNDSTEVMANEPVYTPAEGDVKVVDGEAMVYDNGTWVKAEHDVTLDNGTVVTVDGKAKRPDGTTVEVKDGNVITKTGEWFDKAGHSISNAWEDVKDGVKDGADAVKDGAKKVGEETKDVFDGKDDNK